MPTKLEVWISVTFELSVITSVWGIPKLLREEIGLFYQNLADKDKTVFLDYFIKKMRAKDISISEGVTQESVRSRIKRIRKLAREMIDHTWIMKLLHWLWRLSPVKKEGGR